MAKRKRSIRAGRLCLVTLASMPLPRDPDYVRAEKSRCTSLAQQKLNLKYSCQKLELLLAANFDHHDYYVTLTYDNDHLPADRAAAVKRIQRFIRQLRRHRKARGQDVKYVYTTEGLHNLKYSCQKLELLLAANFDHHDYYVTLTYDNDHLPTDRAAAVKRIQRFIRQLRRHRKARGQDVKYVYTTEGLHDKRLHHHVVINGYDDEEIIRSLWTDGNTDADAFELELLLAANFDHHDYYVTLTYDNDHLPTDRAAAVKRIQRFIRQLRRHRKARGQDVKYVYTTEGLHDKRLHHHVVINGYDDEEIIRSLWTDGNTDADAFDLKQVTALASYMTKEPLEYGKAQVGKRCWSPSRNLDKPVIESEIVSDDLTLAPPLNATVLDQPPVVRTEFGEFVYIKYLLPHAAQSSPFRRRSRKKVHINFDSKPCLS